MKKIKTGDQVIVIAGKDKGKQGSVTKMLSNGRCFVSGIQMVKRHTKPNPNAGIAGGVVEKESSIDSTLLREAYKNFCEERGYKVLSDNNLGQELKRLGIERKRKRQEGIRGYVYEGVRLLIGGVPSCP